MVIRQDPFPSVHCAQPRGTLVAPARTTDCLNSVMADIIADLVGPDVKFHHSKLNFKWANGGEEVKWHYDISFYPHTNYSPLTVGTYLYDCGMARAPSPTCPEATGSTRCFLNTTPKATGPGACPTPMSRSWICRR